MLTKDSEGKTVYENLTKQENLNEFNGNLGKSIFLTFYSSEYNEVWVGIITNELGIDSPEFLSNDYFGDRPKDVFLYNPKNPVPNTGISEKVELAKNKFAELVLKAGKSQ